MQPDENNQIPTNTQTNQLGVQQNTPVQTPPNTATQPSTNNGSTSFGINPNQIISDEEAAKKVTDAPLKNNQQEKIVIDFGKIFKTLFSKNWLIGMFTFLIVAMLGGLGYLYATDLGDPKGLIITNQTANAVTITWVTETPVVGKVIIGVGDNFPATALGVDPGRTFYDDRDLTRSETGEYFFDSSIAQPRKTHHVTLRNLDPTSTYNFIIAGRIRTFSFDVNAITTLAQTEEVSEPEPMYGQFSANNDPNIILTDGIFYYRFMGDLDNTQTSAMYSSIINPSSNGWSGTYNDIYDFEGNPFNVDTQSQFLRGSVIGDGYVLEGVNISLETTKPTETINITL